MNLYQTFRLSLYMLVASAACSLSMVSGNFDLFWIVILCGALAYHFVDCGRLKPMRPIFAAMLSVVMLLYFVTPALRQYAASDSQGAAAQMARFLILLQVVLFFAQFRGSALFAFCGSSLFVVIVSGILDTGPSLLVRLAAFLAMTTWTLFIHALWKQRERFRDSNGGLETPANRETMTLGELSRPAFWQGQRLTIAVTFVSLFLGLTLFFFWPRSNSNFMGKLSESFRPEKSRTGDGQDGGDPLDQRSGISRLLGSSAVTGAAQTVRLDDLDDIKEDHRVAVNITLDRPAGDIAGPSNLLYLRGRGIAKFENNSWFPPRQSDSQWELDNQDGVDFPPKNENFWEPLGRKGLEFRFLQIVSLRSSPSPTYYTLGPPRRLIPPKAQNAGVATDREGALLTFDGRELYPDDPQYTYQLYANLPPREDQLPSGARTIGPTGHYLDWETGFMNPASAINIQKLTDGLLKKTGAITDLDKIRTLRAWLRDSGHYTYTLNLSKVERSSRDFLYDFLLGERPEQRRGHCGYFATAMVVLSRAAGLPARMAVGYSKRLSPYEAKSKLVNFKNSEAHAWVEIYFEQYGWVAFDATPGETAEEIEERVAGNDPSNRQQLPRNKSTASNALPTGPPVKKGVMDEIWSSYILNYDRSQQRELYSSMSSYLSGFAQALNRAFSGGTEWGIAGAVVLWLVLGGIAGWLFLSLLRYRGGRRQKPTALTPRAKAAVDFYNELLQLLSRRGFTRRDGQTPREFAEAVIKRGGTGFGSVRVITSLFEMVRYGGTVPDESQLQKVQAALQELREKVAAKPERS